MTEQTKSAEEIVAVAEFNASVDHALDRVFALNKSLLDEGITTTAITLANALSAADMIAAVIAELALPVEQCETMVTELAADMTKRALAAHAIYAAAKLAAANREEAA